MPTSDCTTYSIYKIVCFRNYRVYIGKTYDVKRRKREHFYNLELNKHYNKELQYAFNKWGASAFYFEVIETGLSKDQAYEREQYWITQFDCFKHGFNETFGGDGTGRPGKKCIWNGIEYDKVRDAARACGINESTMSQRLKRGHTCDTDLIGATGKFTTRQPGSNKKPCAWNGIDYPSLTHCAAANGIGIETLRERFQKGYTCDADLKYRRK